MKKLLALSVAIVAGAALSTHAADGKALYEKHCAMCHGKDGKGDTKMGQRLGVKDYTDPKVQDALTDEAAFKAIKDGFKDKDGKTVMRPTRGMSDDEIKSVVAYLRTFKK